MISLKRGRRRGKAIMPGSHLHAAGFGPLAPSGKIFADNADKTKNMQRMKKLRRMMWVLVFLCPGMAGAEELATEQTAGGTDQAYQLGPLDLVGITVYNEPDLSVEQRLDARGYVQIPLLGNVCLAGLTVRESEFLLENRFHEERFLARPQVSLTVREYSRKEASVLGQVKRPGQVMFPLEAGSMDIVEAISRAGGLTGIAKADAVRIARKDGMSGKEKMMTVNVSRILAGEKKAGKEAPGFRILPGDVIYVPERVF